MLFLTPIVVIICDYLLLGESLTKNEYVGMMIIFIAMCFAFYKKEIIAQMFNKRID